jgi:hypothetical protein
MAEPTDGGCCEPQLSGGGCCGGAPAEQYDYPEQRFEDGVVDTFAGAVPRITSKLTAEDRRGALRVRLNIGRSDYRVKPGLYALGQPDEAAPVIVTANYKLTFDAVREALAGRNLWILVLDTKGINVWCAAGKGTFSTMELISRVIDARLEQIVSHQTVIVPQLGAVGVAGHAVRATTGFRVKWGPVDIRDLPAYLDSDLKPAEGMRRVEFPTRDRAVLIPVEISTLWSAKVLAGIAVAVIVALTLGGMATQGLASVGAAMLVAGLAGILAGAVLVPLLLPWIPGRAFALKGGIVGALLGALVAYGWYGVLGTTGAVAAMSIATAISSFAAMNFTGSSTYTSPSGVEWEMRRAIPVQLALLVGWVVLTIAALIA